MVCLPCLLSRPPAMCPDLRIDCTLYDHPRWNKNSFIFWGMATWPINFGADTSPPVRPWIARKSYETLLAFSQYWNLVLLLPSWMWWSQPLSENRCPPDVWNASLSLELLEFQWTAPSVSLSCWSQWRTNLTTNFEISAERVFRLKFYKREYLFTSCYQYE